MSWPKEFTKDVLQQLLAPFPLDEIEFLPKTKSKDGTKAMALCYIDARAVMRRLDEVVGPGGWSWDWEILSEVPGKSKGSGLRIKGRLTVLGVTKCEMGEYWVARDNDDMEQGKAAVSDALKRCGVHFGVGRFLYFLDSFWQPIDQWGKWLNPPTIHPKAMENACRIVGYEGKVEVKPATVKRDAPVVEERPTVTRQQVTEVFGEAPPESSPFDNTPEEHTPAPKPVGGKCAKCARTVTPGQLTYTMKVYNEPRCSLHQDKKKAGQ